MKNFKEFVNEENFNDSNKFEGVNAKEAYEAVNLDGLDVYYNKKQVKEMDWDEDYTYFVKVEGSNRWIEVDENTAMLVKID